MKLNPDCIRAILLTVENETDISKVFEIDEEHYVQYSCLKDFEYDEIAYHILQCKYSDYFTDTVHRFDNSFIIFDLTPKGHEFIANIRNDKDYKNILQKAFSTSVPITLSVIEEIAKSFFINKLGL